MCLSTMNANQCGLVRRERLNGREYLIAPLTLLVPGVLNGSKGPLLYTPEDTARSAAAWEGVPIVIDHPTRGGSNVSARAPGVLAESGVGTVRNANFSGGKLRAEGWFDVAAVRRKRPALLADLAAGRKIELSTGLFTDNEPARPGATHGGRPYGHVARAHRPDHLAILPDRRGACSLDDGCGVNNCDCGGPDWAAVFRDLEVLANGAAEVYEVLPPTAPLFVAKTIR